MKIYRLLIVSCIEIVVCTFQKQNIISILCRVANGMSRDIQIWYINTIFYSLLYTHIRFHLVFAIRTQMYTRHTYVYGIVAEIESGSVKKNRSKMKKKIINEPNSIDNGEVEHTLFSLTLSLRTFRWFAINSTRTWPFTHTRTYALLGHMSRQIYLHTRVCLCKHAAKVGPEKATEKSI